MPKSSELITIAVAVNVLQTSISLHDPRSPTSWVFLQPQAFKFLSPTGFDSLLYADILIPTLRKSKYIFAQVWSVILYERS
jgi:hypothetical protein